LEAAGRREQGESLVADPRQVVTSYGPWWAIRGRWARLRGNENEAQGSFSEAVAADPFDVESACESVDPEGVAASSTGDHALCGAARALGAPPFGAGD
ncbi:MAG: hypothetical protein M3O50_17305, partial [Myxococcota bacterium]|nr:hypothetical protein [Myxococcota bacterium]